MSRPEQSSTTRSILALPRIVYAVYRNGLTPFLQNNPGSDLLSHTPAHAVPSAVAGLTSVFGMGTGVTLPL